VHRKKDVSFRPESFVLCERASGAVRFRVLADPDGGMPVEQVAGLLAMHCLVRGQAPEDFEVMVVARNLCFKPWPSVPRNFWRPGAPSEPE